MHSLFRIMMQKLRRGWRRSRSRSASNSSSSTEDVREPSTVSRASQSSHKSLTSRKSTGSQSAKSIRKRAAKSNDADSSPATIRTLHSNLSAQCSADTLSTSSSQYASSGQHPGPSHHLHHHHHHLLGSTWSPVHHSIDRSGTAQSSVTGTPTHSLGDPPCSPSHAHSVQNLSNESSSHQSSLADFVPELPQLNVNASPLTLSASASYSAIGSRTSVTVGPEESCADVGCASDEQSLSLPNLSPNAPPPAHLTMSSSPTSPSLLSLDTRPHEPIGVSSSSVTQSTPGYTANANASGRDTVASSTFSGGSSTVNVASHDSDEQQSNASGDEDSPELSSDTESVISAELTIDLTKGYRSKSLDASVVLAMARANNLGATGKPRSSAPFLEIPKWRLFIRKPSTDTTGTGLERSAHRIQIQLTDIFRDCVHCKCLTDLQRLMPQSAAALDAFGPVNESTDRNNNELTRIREQNVITPSIATTGAPVSTTTTSVIDDGLTSESLPPVSAEVSSAIPLDANVAIPPSDSINSDTSARLFRKTKTPPVRNTRYARAIPLNVPTDSSTSGSLSSLSLNVSSVNATAAAPVSMSTELNKCSTGYESVDISQTQSVMVAPPQLPARRLPSVTLSEVSDDDPSTAPLGTALGDLLQATTECFSATGSSGPGQPCIGIQVTDMSSFHAQNEELDDPGSGITVISLEVPLLSPGSGKQARSASVDSSFLQVPPRPDIGSCELPPTKSSRSRSVDIALPEGPDGPYLVVPNANQRPITTK